ncbi:MAG: hypothetical protein ACR2PT_23190 [Endozoicomonas sp.]
MQSSKLALAGLYNSHVTGYLGHWREQTGGKVSDYRIPPEQLEIAVRSSEKALKLVPKSNKALFNRFKLYEWEAGFTEQPAVDTNEESARYQQAISLRPAWPHLYMDYAMAEARRRDLGDQFQQSIIQATSLGPWEPQVLERMATFHFHYKGWLTPEVETALDANLQRLAKAFPRKTLAIARQYKVEKEVCPLLNQRYRTKACKMESD